MKRVLIGSSGVHRTVTGFVACLMWIATVSLAPTAAFAATPVCDGQTATIMGTTGNDTLLGTAADDVIAGLGGADVIRGLRGEDHICGGSGNDVIHGGPGSDGLIGGNGDDTLRCGPGFDDGGLSGGDGDDKLYAKSLCSNALHPGPGDDLIVGGTNQWDAVFYEDATGPINANLTTGIATGQGTDTLVKIDCLFGGPYGDTLIGSNVNDWLVGGAGDDTLIGHGGNDIFSGEQDDDIYQGGHGFDRAEYWDDAAAAGRVIGPMNINLRTGIATGDGTDTLGSIEAATGSNKSDTLVGNAKTNLLTWTFGGNDTVMGGGGDDFIESSPGTNTLKGGAGSDMVFYLDGRDLEHQHGAVTVNLEKGRSSSGDTLSGFEAVFGSPKDDIIIGDNGANNLFGWLGDDLLKGGVGADRLHGMDGSDLANGGQGTDRCHAEVRRNCEPVRRRDRGGSRQTGEPRHARRPLISFPALPDPEADGLLGVSRPAHGGSWA